MSMLNNLLSSIDPSATVRPPPISRQTQAPATTKSPSGPPAHVQARPQAQAQPLKRKADGQLGSEQAKAPRKDGPPHTGRSTLVTRPGDGQDANRARTATPTGSYRGTAGLHNTAKASGAVTKKPTPVAGTQLSTARSAQAVSKPNVGASSVPPTVNAAAPKKTGYAAMLAKAEAAQKTKPLPPPVKHESTKLLTKKERMELREQAKARAKGKATGPSNPPLRVGNSKPGVLLEKQKPIAPSGYQGTARPNNKPAESGYKGTSRPTATASGVMGKRPGPGAGKYGAQQSKKRVDNFGYADWDELEEMDDEEEEDEEGYGSDGSSDMEGGIFDLEREEELALKAAKQEDAEALREENEKRRQKEERKKKLNALVKAATNKRSA